MEQVITCLTCGLVQRMDAEPPAGSTVSCVRCNFVIHSRKQDSRTRTFCLAPWRPEAAGETGSNATGTPP